MNIHNDSPFLHFNFATSDGNRNPIIFSDPINIIMARTIEEIEHCFHVVQQAVDEGYYAAGYVSYEAAPAFNPEFKVKTGQVIPLLWFGIFNAPIQKTIESKGTFQTSEWIPSVSIENYNHCIDQIHNYIKQSKTEQVNYTIKMESRFNGDTAAFYKQLEQAQAADYTALLDIGDSTIISASPELFFQIKDGYIKTKPMAGTVARGKTYEQDNFNAEWLANSEKNRLENEMIVQIMIKDLEKIAENGIVHVPKRYEVEKYPTVYQMTSTVTAEIAKDKGFFDIFKAMFPCASITGLPKTDTMEIIAELEQAPREVYCGAIGYITPDREAIFNVPIRTVLIDNQSGKASYGVGGGITLASTKKEEYDEVLAKAEVLRRKQPPFQLLESLGLVEGRYLVLDEHLQRLKRSADYFDIKINIQAIKMALLDFAKEYPENHYKVRLLVTKDGNHTIEANELVTIYPDVIHVGIADQPIDKDNVFLYHKTTNRKMYEEHREKQRDVFDVLLWNDQREITEFTGGNVVVELEGVLVTPPVESGLLAGTFRESLVKNGTVIERTITLDELKEHGTKIWFINSVRKWIPVQFKDQI